MGFNDEDRILMESLYIFKSHGAKKLTGEFPNKGWSAEIEQTYEKLLETGTTTRRNGSIKSIQNLSCFSIL